MADIITGNLTWSPKLKQTFSWFLLWWSDLECLFIQVINHCFSQYMFTMYIYIYLCLCLCTFILFLNLFIYCLHETDLEPWIVFVILWLQSMGTTSTNYPDMLRWFPPCSWRFLLLGSTYIDWNLLNHTKYCNLGCVQGKLASMVKHILENLRGLLICVLHVWYIFPTNFQANLRCRLSIRCTAGNTELNAFARSLHWQLSLAQLQTVRSNFLADRFSYNSALHGLEMKDVMMWGVSTVIYLFWGRGGFGGKDDFGAPKTLNILILNLEALQFRNIWHFFDFKSTRHGDHGGWGHIAVTIGLQELKTQWCPKQEV